MTKKNYSKYEAKEELVTLSFNHVLLHKKDTKIYQVIFLSLLREGNAKNYLTPHWMLAKCLKCKCLGAVWCVFSHLTDTSLYHTHLLW